MFLKKYVFVIKKLSKEVSWILDSTKKTIIPQKGMIVFLVVFIFVKVLGFILTS